MDDDIREPHLQHGDFLGAFGLLRRGDALLLCQNQRHIDGRDVLTWDLPGGQVEPGELLGEALAREVHEEVGIAIAGAPRFLFLQEGERRAADRRLYAWRSFFFECREWTGEPRPCSEIVAVRWFEPGELRAVLTAPYHDCFVRWLAEGGTFFGSRWADD